MYRWSFKTGFNVTPTFRAHTWSSVTIGIFTVLFELANISICVAHSQVTRIHMYIIMSRSRVNVKDGCSLRNTRH